MKRVAIGALFLSLAAGSVAMAGQGHPAGVATRAERSHDGHRDDDRNRGRDDHRGGNHDDRGNRNDHGNNHWRNGGRDDHRRDNRWHDGRRDDHRPDGGRNDWRNDHRNDGRNQGWRNDHRRYDWSDHRYDSRRNVPRYDWNRGHYDGRYDSWNRPRYHVGVYHRPWGWYDHHWIRGERLPHGYYARPYVISDYYGCGLRRPPYGHHWVRVDGDAVLAVIATGVILDVIYNQFY